MSDWHFELSDGSTRLRFLCTDPVGREHSLRYWQREPLERSAMKLGQGRTKYDDLIPPWYAIAQDDWSGGRGSYALLDDPTKYEDAEGVQTWIPKRLVLGPERHEDFDSRASVDTGDPSISSKWDLLSGGAEYRVGQMFSLSRVMTVVKVQLRMTLDSYTGTLTLKLMGTGGDPLAPDEDDVRGTVARTFSSATEDGWIEFDFSSQGVTLQPGHYAAVIYPDNTGGTTCDWWNTDGQYSGGDQVERGSDSEPWLFYSCDLTLRVNDEVDSDTGTVQFFHAFGLLYAAVSASDEKTQLWRRGIIGTATGGTVETVVDSGAPFSGCEGATITLVSGKGAGQRREITSVSADKTTVTVGMPFDVAPDSTTVYSVTRGWVYVDEFDGAVFDVLVVDDVAYFARGADALMKRYTWTSSAGDTLADDGSNHAERLALFRDQDNEPAIWRSLGHEISAAGLQAWGTDLTFGTEIRVGSDDSRITALEVYDDHLYICKEDGLYAIEDDIVRHVPVDFAALRSPANGVGMVAWNLYLIFPLLEGLERLYGNQVDDFGPNGGRGLPEGRQGPVSALLPLPGMLVAAIDADSYSSVMVFNNLGWHELVRSPEDGRRITALAYEVLEENNARLWWNEGTRLCYAWMSPRVFDRSRDENADYCESGTITLAWMGTDLADVDKVWHQVTVLKEQDRSVSGWPATVAVSYRVDDEDAAWTSATQTESSDTLDRFDLGNVRGRRLQLRLTLTRGYDVGSNPVTPEVTAVTVDALGRIEMAHAYQTHVALDKIAVSMAGTPERVDPAAALSTLDGWASGATPLTLTHVLPVFSGKTVVLEPIGARVETYTAGPLEQKLVLEITLIELV